MPNKSEIQPLLGIRNDLVSHVDVAFQSPFIHSRQHEHVAINIVVDKAWGRLDEALALHKQQDRGLVVACGCLRCTSNFFLFKILYYFFEIKFYFREII